MGGQGGRAVAIDLFVVYLIITAINFYSYAPVARFPSPYHSSFVWTIGGDISHGTEMLGAVLLFFGAAWGLTVAAVAMIVNISLTVSSSWLPGRRKSRLNNKVQEHRIMKKAQSTFVGRRTAGSPVLDS
jgi:hypothetical protein